MLLDAAAAATAALTPSAESPSKEIGPQKSTGILSSFLDLFIFFIYLSFGFVWFAVICLSLLLSAELLDVRSVTRKRKISIYSTDVPNDSERYGNTALTVLVASALHHIKNLDSWKIKSK